MRMAAGSWRTAFVTSAGSRYAPAEWNGRGFASVVVAVLLASMFIFVLNAGKGS